MIELTINGQAHSLEVPGDMPILWVLRDVLHLTGTRFSCGMALCGACVVHLDGEPIRACLTPIALAAGKTIDTIEAMADDSLGRRVQQAWMDEAVAQCGFCQSGQIMSAVALLKNTPNPSDDEIDSFMSGNLCRCGTYPRIRKAIHRAADSASLASTSAAETPLFYEVSV
ncbi:(2Fe-2S)-binding protein [Halioxenophilus sp. WMMB6]|uniref:(2Fe-2S)-binding protein n=1 Tax=Halioxenophilus sp. WMMB6 TaxID=3073815 RepID=UPI00295F3E27|nr:(2Fe-2S)-binding protein [Halioxenophilus sp. WMMB6]